MSDLDEKVSDFIDVLTVKYDLDMVQIMSVMSKIGEGEDSFTVGDVFFVRDDKVNEAVKEHTCPYILGSTSPVALEEYFDLPSFFFSAVQKDAQSVYLLGNWLEEHENYDAFVESTTSLDGEEAALSYATGFEEFTLYPLGTHSYYVSNKF